jgi:hypothetical protein
MGRECGLEFGVAPCNSPQKRSKIRILTAAPFRLSQGENGRALRRSGERRYLRIRPRRCALIAKYPVKPVRKTLGRALGIINFA